MVCFKPKVLALRINAVAHLNALQSTGLRPNFGLSTKFDLILWSKTET